MDDARAGAPHRVADLIRLQAAREQPERRPPAAQRGAVALQHLGLLGELGTDQPGQVRDRALLAAGHPIPVVQQEDHAAEPKLIGAV